MLDYYPDVDHMRTILGILGGMGPLASAEFVRSVYELNVQTKEQASPVCVLYSDPTIPDRTMERRTTLRAPKTRAPWVTT